MKGLKRTYNNECNLTYHKELNLPFNPIFNDPSILFRGLKWRLSILEHYFF